MKAVLNEARESMAAYVDMGHFREPERALPFLIDGFQFGLIKGRADALPLVKALQRVIAHGKEAEEGWGPSFDEVEAECKKALEEYLDKKPE